MDIAIEYLKVFITGGLICTVGQILIDKTKITPARILTLFVVLGVVLGFLGSCLAFGTGEIIDSYTPKKQ